MKLALISHTLPPAWSGQAIVIYRMLEHLNPESYCLISSRADGIDGDASEYMPALAGSRYQIPEAFKIWRGLGFGMQHVNIWIAIIQRARYLIRIIKSQKCDLVLAWTGNVLDLPAAYIASRRVGLPFYACIQDHYSKREWNDPIARFWASRLEAWLIRGATKVIVANETLRDDLHTAFGVEATVIHNSCDVSEYEKSVPSLAGSENTGIRITYTGDIYEAHYDAFRNLIAALKIIGRDDVKLHLYTTRSAEYLADFGISGPTVLHPHHGPSEIPSIQQQADILFLPLAFDSPYPDVIRTSSTAKVGEFMAARRPVLVHAPAGSFISWYFRRYECGLVVDHKDPVALAQAVSRLLSDSELRERLIANAWQRAQEDFSLSKARAQFAELLGLEANAKLNSRATYSARNQSRKLEA